MSHAWTLYKKLEDGRDYFRCTTCDIRVVVPVGKALPEIEDKLPSCEDVKKKSANVRPLDNLVREVENGVGVGSQLWKLNKRLGIGTKNICSNCLNLAITMNKLGPKGCKEHREDLIKLLRKNAKNLGWADYLKAGANALVLGWALKINPKDPISDMLDYAIKKAEEEELS